MAKHSNNYGSQFLHEQQGTLHTSTPVERANQKAEESSQKPTQKIASFLARYKHVLQPQATKQELDTTTQERNLQMLLPKLYEELVIESQDIPYAAFELEQQIARSLGHGDVTITEEFKERKTQEIRGNQQESIKYWATYLTSPDADYPDYAKYWAFTGMQTMGKLVKKEQEDGSEKVYFAKRTKDTVAPYSVCNAAALAKSISALDVYLQEQDRRKKLSKAKRKQDSLQLENTSTQLTDTEFTQLIATKSFSAIYAQFLKELPEYTEEGLENIQGEWIQYKQNSDAARLVESLKGYPLEWCTANQQTAQGQLQGGDFYVYYSQNSQGEHKIPRVAIRMEQDNIAEVRGIAASQEVDPYITPVIQTKMQEFGTEGKQYQKKASDMQQMTVLMKKQEHNEQLNAQELRFLYELDSTIEGFGYNNKDPRIKELREQRDAKKDVLTVFDCTQDQVATSGTEITTQTKVYIGAINKEALQYIQQFSIDYAYTSFPETPIALQNLTIGTLSSEELLCTLKQAKDACDINILGYAQSMLDNRSEFQEPTQSRFESLDNKGETLNLVTLQVKDLGFSSDPTTVELFAKATELGLELCPKETAAYLRLQDTNQPRDDWYYIASQTVPDSDGRPRVFDCEHDAGGLWLRGHWTEPGDHWRLSDRVVFRFSKSDSDT
jgi:hypothetical protein